MNMPIITGDLRQFVTAAIGAEAARNGTRVVKELDLIGSLPRLTPSLPEGGGHRVERWRRPVARSAPPVD